MAQGPSNVVRTRATVESSHAVDRTGTIGNFFDLRLKPMMMPPATRAMLPDERQRTSVWQAYAATPGFRSSAFDVAGDLVSTGVEYSNGVANTKDSLSTVLEALAGGYDDPTGTLVASGASPTGVTITGGEGATAGIEPASIVGIETTSTSERFVPTQVKTRATDALTFTHALGFTPAVGGKVIGSQMIYPGSSPSATLQWLFDAFDRSTILAMFGCQGDLKIDWTLGATAKWSSSQKAALYAYDSELATPQGGAAIGATTAVAYTGSEPVPLTAGSVVISPMAGTLRTLPRVSKLEMSLGLKWVAVDSFNAVDTGGNAAWVLVPDAVTGTFQVPRDTIIYEQARDAQTKYRLFASGGNTGGEMLAFSAPTIVFTDVKTDDRNGLPYQTVSWMALMNEDCTDQSTDLRKAPWYLARL
jgi:hypothetical protein